MTPEHVEQEIALVNQHIQYQRTRRGRLEQEIRDMTRAYQLRMIEIGDEIGEAQQNIDELTVLRKRLYDRRNINRKKEDGREHPPENGER